MPGHVAPAIPIPDVDLWAFLFEQKNKPFSDNQVLYTCPETGRYYTYADVERTARGFGSGLVSRFSWQKGDVLAIVSPNCIDTPAITWGCHWAGGIVSPANPDCTQEELTRHLRNSDAKALVTQKHSLAQCIKATTAAGLSISRIILIGEIGDTDGQFEHFTSLLDFSSSTRWRATIDPQVDLAFLVFSSGTTGQPKGVMLSHSNIVSELTLIKAGDGKSLTSSKDKILSVLPYYHIYGLIFLVHLPLCIGVESVIMTQFNIDLFCSIIQNSQITYTYVAPPILMHLAKHPTVASYNLSSLRMITCGAAPLSKELIMAVYNRLSIPTKQAYGLSETTAATHVQTWDSWRTAMGSIGQAHPNLTVKYVDLNGDEALPGEAGEVWIKGPTVFKGYHNNLQATSDAITPCGFFKTGDIGFEDQHGNMYITDRIKELIKYKGFQIAPAELEGYISSHPMVKDIAVVGFYVDAIASEVPLTYVVPNHDVERTEENAIKIIDWLAARVAKYKQLRGGIIWTDVIPKSASGKILRRQLRKLSLEGKMKSMGGREFMKSPVVAKL